MSELEELAPDPKIRCTAYRIGCIGAGFIMADVQLAAYRRAGFQVMGISSRSEAHASQVAARPNAAMMVTLTTINPAGELPVASISPLIAVIMTACSFPCEHAQFRP